jgi:hypothetical protein
MSLVRRFALWLAEFVVRHASPGAREWAEGLARETGEIPGDWAALVWTLGSLRVLADRKDRLETSREQFLATAGNALIAAKRNRWGMFLASYTVVFTQHLVNARTVEERVGCCMVLVPCVARALWNILRSSDRSRDKAKRDDASLLDWYRRKLNDDVLCAGLPGMMAVFSVFLGFSLSERGGIAVHPWWNAIHCVGAMGCVAWMHRRRQIDQTRLQRLLSLTPGEIEP